MLPYWMLRPKGKVAKYLAGGIASSNVYAAYEPKDAASLALSYINVHAPGTRDATVITAPTHAQGTGWILNGTDQYLILPFALPALASSIFVRFTGGGVLAAATVCGAQTITFLTALNAKASGLGNGTVYSASSDAVNVAVAATSLSIAGERVYRDGAYVGAVATRGAAQPGDDLYVGCLNNEGIPDTFCPCNISYLYAYIGNVDAAQMAALYAATA